MCGISTVNAKTKKILAMQVTDEHVLDNKALPVLVYGMIKSNNVTTAAATAATAIGKLFADGAYDSNDIFEILADNGILPCIKVRKNSRIRWRKGNSLRNLSGLVQKNNLQKWKMV